MSACSIQPKWQLYFLAIDIVPPNCAYFPTHGEELDEKVFPQGPRENGFFVRIAFTWL
jgi:hypothetical protein